MLKRVIEHPEQAPRIYGDVPSFMALPHQPPPALKDLDAVVLGMPFDGLATLRGGATRHAPAAIRKMSMLYGGYNLDWDFEVFDYLKVVDRGDIDVVLGNAAESYRRLEMAVAEIVRAGAFPVMLGGDHGVTYPAVKGLTESLGRGFGVIIFDTHLDLCEQYRNDRLSRASPLKRICELAHINPKRVCVIGAKGPRNLPEWMPLARDLGIRIFTLAEVETRGMRAVAEEALALATSEGCPPYVSVDIDAVDAAFAPGTNSVDVGGLTSREIIMGTRIVCERGVAGFDVVEVAPEWDGGSHITSTLAARLVAEMFAAVAAKRAGKTRAWDFMAQ